MVLRLKSWESRSLPGFQNFVHFISFHQLDAGWSSPVARQAHNLKVAGSNPAPATNIFKLLQLFSRFRFVAAFYILNYCRVHCRFS